MKFTFESKIIFFKIFVNREMVFLNLLQRQTQHFTISLTSQSLPFLLADQCKS